MKTNPALNALRSALEISPDNLPLRRHLATTLADAGQLAEAQNELQEVLRQAADEWPDTAKNYAMYSNQSGLYDAIAQYLQKGGE